MVKRKKLSNSENSDEKCEEDLKTSESVPATNVTCKTTFAAPIGEAKDSIGTTITRSKTALQLQQQSNSNATEPVVPQEIGNNETKGSIEGESVNNVSNSVNAKIGKPIVRPNKKSKKDLNGQASDIRNSKKVNYFSLHEVPGKLIPRQRRAWEVWSKEDIDLFFEGLFEYGKDFEKMQAFVVQRSKKKGAQFGFTKNKDQVRHFYYRTWQKLSKHIALEDSVNKVAQEVCIMINYAELRRKLGREPKCEDAEKMPKLPSHIKVMFCPKDNATWSKIQALSMNPRVKLRMSLQKRFSDVIEFLQRRWKPYRLKVLRRVGFTSNRGIDALISYKELMMIFTFQKDRLLSGLPPSRQNLDVKSSSHNEILKIIPRIMPETDIHPISVALTDTSTSNQNFTLKDFISSPESSKLKKALKPKQMTDTKETPPSAILPVDETILDADENDLKDLKDLKPDVLKDPLVTDASSGVNKNNMNSANVDCASKDESSGIATLNESESSTSPNCKLNLDAVKEGFTATSAVSLTVGQLFLMMNRPETMILDYDWVPIEESEPSSTKYLTHTLKELVLAASVSFADISKIKQNAVASGNVTACSCGHLCQQSTKSSHKASTVSRSPARSANTVNRVYIAKQQISSNSGDAEDHNKSVPNTKQDTFLKPLAVAPRSTAQVSSRSPNMREQFVGIGSLRRPPMRARQWKKSIIGQRTLLPKALTAQQATPMVTVQLMPTANLPQGNQSDCIQKVTTPNSTQVLRLMPGSKILDISSVGILDNITLPSTKTDVMQTNQNHISVNSNEMSHQPIINTITNDILSTLTASIIEDTESKQLESESNIGQSQTNKPLPVVSAAENLVQISSQSLPRISIPESNMTEQTANLPHNLTALLNTTLQSDNVNRANVWAAVVKPKASFINDTQPHHTLSSLIHSNSNDGETRAELSSAGNMGGEQQILHSSSSEQLVHPPSPGLGSNWLDSENSEYTFSTLLGTLESPTKSGSTVLHHSSVSMHSENSSLDGIGRLAPDVDTQLQCLMNENSIDYVSKFADLAAHIASSDHKK
ncbi:Protein cramped-like [Nymphon striatum]|nr:Protein cramped-like [Nymphon striatum]